MLAYSLLFFRFSIALTKWKLSMQDDYFKSFLLHLGSCYIMIFLSVIRRILQNISFGSENKSPCWQLHQQGVGHVL